MKKNNARMVMMSIILGLWLGLALPNLSLAETTPLHSPVNTLDDGAQEVKTAPVVIDGAVLFLVRGTSSYPAEKRARTIADRIEALAADPAFVTKSLVLQEETNTTLIRGGRMMVMALTDADASLENVDRQILALTIVSRVGEAIDAWRRDRNPQYLKQGAIYSLGATILFILALWVGFRLFHRLSTAIEARFQTRVHDLHVQSFQIVRAGQLWHLFTRFHNFLWILLFLAGLYTYLHNVLIVFPWTRGVANELFTFMVAPLRTIGLGIVRFIPSLLFLIVLFLLTRYVLKLLRLFFATVDTGTVVLSNFEAEWALPTYRLVRLGVIAFALIVAYPYIPGSDSEAFKGISIFVGVIFSLGSSSVIGNLIAGYTMIYRRAFRVGDRIQIGEHVGDVEAIRLMVTHLRTPKNEEVVISNSNILAGEVINFSTMAKKQGLILHTTVGIGYETPWRQVEAMLIEAATRTPGLLLQPSPFVLLKGLGDFCVTYEINVYCATAQGMNHIYAALHRNVLDLFNEYGVQIMTPSYEGDPEQPKLVPKEQWYAAPARLPDEEIE